MAKKSLNFSEGLTKLEKIATEIKSLVEEKSLAQGGAFLKSEKILKILYPNGIKPEQYKDLLAVIRVVDKLFSLAAQKETLSESFFNNIAEYVILNVADGDTKEA